MQPLENELARAILDAQITRHEARARLKRAPHCTRWAAACPAAESARNDPRLEEKNLSMRNKSVFRTCSYVQGSLSGCV